MPAKCESQVLRKDCPSAHCGHQAWLQHAVHSRGPARTNAFHRQRFPAGGHSTLEERGDSLLFLFFYARIREGKHSQEIAQFQAELAEARAQLQLLQKQLDEQLSKQPVGNQEVMVRGGWTHRAGLAGLDSRVPWVTSLHPAWGATVMVF